jgi:hypothetical protein
VTGERPAADLPADAKVTTVTIGALHRDGTAAATSWSVPPDVADKVRDLLEKYVGPAYSRRMMTTEDAAKIAHAPGVLVVEDPEHFRRYPT